MTDLAADGVSIYSTCRSSFTIHEQSRLSILLEIAGWADEAGYRGGLVYTDSAAMDAWLAAQAVIVNTTDFVPLIAVQPMDMSPFALARAVSTLAQLYGRRVDLNFVSGGFGRDLAVQGDELSHDARYDRLVEYVTIVRMLLGGGMANFTGKYFNVRRARLTTPVPAELMPMMYVSGSSAASLQAADSLGTGRLSYPLPPDEFAGSQVAKGKFSSGLILGMIARDDSSEAWRIARKRFPVDPEGAARMKLLLSASESTWQSQLASVPIADEGEGTYWMVPFRYRHSFAPYLVGSYDEVAQAVTAYLNGGIRSFILDAPEHPDDLYHNRIAIERAVAAMDR